MNPYVFLVGCPRSGTTLLRRLVDAHPQIAITPETQWVTRLRKKHSDPITPALIPALLEQRKFPELGITRDQLESLRETTYAGFVSRIYDLYGHAHGKQLVGDKTSGYVRKLPALHALWPSAKFVHIIRDGRDVCLSVLNWSKAHRASGRYATWSEDPVATTALWWKFNVQLAREDGRQLPHYLEVRYESVVADPVSTCRELCRFLELPVDDAMAKFHERLPEAGIEAEHAWGPVQNGCRDWSTQMPAEKVARFETMVGDFLEELGYPRTSPQRHDGIYERFTADVRAKQQRLPQSW